MAVPFSRVSTRLNDCIGIPYPHSEWMDLSPFLILVPPVSRVHSRRPRNGCAGGRRDKRRALRVARRRSACMLQRATCNATLQEEEPGGGSSAPLPGASPAGEPAPRSTTGSVADTGAKLTAATAGRGARKLLTASERHRIGRIKSPAGNFYPPLPSGVDTSIPNISTSARRTALYSL